MKNSPAVLAGQTAARGQNMHIPELGKQVLAWYEMHGRKLPWRDRSDPYAIWISEIMLQQTRVETVIPYYEEWLRRFPTVQHLASATEQEVLSTWEGLGYYSRARNLHKAARIVRDDHGGKIPSDPDALRTLPGIGRYTAGAIASIAFGLHVPTLDANLRRVLARVFNVSQPADQPEGEALLWALAASHLPERRAGDFNQALMDLGATICVSRNPRCLLCPLSSLCKARELGVEEQRPVLAPKKSVPSYVHAAGVIVKGGRVLLARRPEDGLLGGMWEFPNVRVSGDPARALGRGLKTAYRLKVRRGAALELVRHAYTHFLVTVHPFFCQVLDAPRGGPLKWVRLAELPDYPMGKVDRQIARRLVGTGR